MTDEEEAEGGTAVHGRGAEESWVWSCERGCPAPTMANRMVEDAHSTHGTNPQYLVEKIIRTRIYESQYWKEECFGLTAELVVDKAMELKYVGGIYGGNIKPTPFLCLTLKMLQIQPEKDIIVEFIKNEDFK